MATKVTEVLDLSAFPDSPDVLLVRGTVDGYDGVLEARGWVSAMTNYYPANAYDANGNLKLKKDVIEGHRQARTLGGKAVTNKADSTGRALGDPVVKARKMTKAEKLAYCKSLLEAEHPPGGAKKLSIRG